MDAVGSAASSSPTPVSNTAFGVPAAHHTRAEAAQRLVDDRWQLTLEAVSRTRHVDLEPHDRRRRRDHPRRGRPRLGGGGVEPDSRRSARTSLRVLSGTETAKKLSEASEYGVVIEKNVTDLRAELHAAAA
jgi:hypothetical protein